MKTLTRDRRTQKKIYLQIGISDVFIFFLNLQCLSHTEREADKGHHAHSQWRSSRPRRQMATKQLKPIFARHRVPWAHFLTNFCTHKSSKRRQEAPLWGHFRGRLGWKRGVWTGSQIGRSKRTRPNFDLRAPGPPKRSPRTSKMPFLEAKIELFFGINFRYHFKCHLKTKKGPKL